MNAKTDIEAITRGDVLAALARHQGRANGVHIGELVREITGGDTAPGLERHVRRLINAARTEEGSHICGKPNTGYFMATTPAEIEETCEFHRRRAMSSLRALSKMRGVSIPDLLGQLRLRT